MVKKDNLFFWIIILGIVGGVIILLLGVHNTLSVFISPSTDLVNYATLSFSNTGTTSAYYSFTASATPSGGFNNPITSVQRGGDSTSQPLDQKFLFEDVYPPNSNIQLNIPFNATVTVTNPTGAYFAPGYGYATQIIPLQIQNQTATCTAFWSGSSTYNYDNVVCNVKGVAYPLDSNLTSNGGTFLLFSANSIVFQGKIATVGTQCLDNSQCSLGLTCQNNQCVSLPQTYYELSNNTCIVVSKLSSQATSNDYATLSDCQKSIIYEPIPPQPKGFLGLLQSINHWISNFIHNILGLNIAGNLVVQPNTVNTYFINMSVNPVVDDLINGYRTWHFGSYGLVDSNNNTINVGNPIPINDSYIQNVTLTTPANIGDYALIGIVEEINATFNQSTGTWIYSNSTIIDKEAIKLSNYYSITEPTQPTPVGFAKFWQSIISFIKSLFGIK